MKIIAGLLVLVILAGFGLLFGTSSETALTVNPPVTAVGTETPVKVQIANPHGVRHVTAWLEQVFGGWKAAP